MSAYIVVNIESIRDPEGFERYRQGAPATVAAHGGTYLAVGGDAAVLEGAWQPGTLVILRFPGRDAAQEWWESDEYAPLKELRQQSTDSTFVLMDGLDG